MDGCAFTLCAYANVKHTNTNIFSVYTPCHIMPQWSSITLMLENIRENVFRTTVSLLSFSNSCSVPLCARTNFSLFLFEGVQTGWNQAGNLITGHYEAEIFVWLLCNVTLAGTCYNGGAEGHHVKSFSARCNQSLASSWYKNKQLDFQSIWL